MSRIDRLQHRFVNSFPDNPESGVLYIALDFVTMSHLCCCGCGQEVITPLSPNDWKMIFDGQSITLHPSIETGLCPVGHIILFKTVRYSGQVIGVMNKSEMGVKKI